VSKRIERVSQLIKKELSILIKREIEIPDNILLTVTRVDVSNDLRDANVHISVYPEERFIQTMDNLQSKIGLLQSELNKILKMRPLPRLNFLKEKETAEAGRIEELLEQLKKEEQ
jgi:ribosome-binding factor A